MYKYCSTLELLAREANTYDRLEILTSDAFTTMIIHTLTVDLNNCMTAVVAVVGEKRGIGN